MVTLHIDENGDCMNQEWNVLRCNSSLGIPDQAPGQTTRKPDVSPGEILPDVKPVFYQASIFDLWWVLIRGLCSKYYRQKSTPAELLL